MMSVEYNNENIQIKKERKKLFGGIKEEIIVIPLVNIDKVGKELFNETLNSMTIFLKNGTEEFIIAEELEDASVINNLFEFLLEKRNEYSYKLSLVDIATLEEKEL